MTTLAIVLACFSPAILWWLYSRFVGMNPESGAPDDRGGWFENWLNKGQKKKGPYDHL